MLINMFVGRPPDNYDRRKQWIQDRLKELADIFAVAVAGFSVMNNHRSEPGGRKGRGDSGSNRLYIDQAARGQYRG